MLGSPFDPTLQNGLLSRATFDADDASIGEQVRSDSIVVWWNEALLDGRSGRRRALSWPTFSSAALQAGLSLRFASHDIPVYQEPDPGDSPMSTTPRYFDRYENFALTRSDSGVLTLRFHTMAGP